MLFVAADVSFGKLDFSKCGESFQWEHQNSSQASVVFSDFYVGPNSVLRARSHSPDHVQRLISLDA